MISIESRHAARLHLRRSDPVMRRVIDQIGPFTLRLERNRFAALLVRSIISQQISVGSARAIRSRLEQVVVPDKVTSINLRRLNPIELRSAGLSPRMAQYVFDLAEKEPERSQVSASREEVF